MLNDLEKLLNNAYIPHDDIKVSAIVTMKDGITFSGVNVKNEIFRDAIYAEQAAIARAVAAGYKHGDFEKLCIMINTNSINDLKYLNRDIIIEFMEPSCEVILYDINRNQKELKVKDLLFTNF